ncbi:MAG TPA: 3-isopropylmalate dehydratase small subunit [Vicinamibacterales bacterium]
MSREITVVEGRAIPVPGHDIDTDRIMPARFLKAVTFEGLEGHAFEDDRAAAQRAGTRHPFDDPAFQGASILLVNRNFGCGSSREHAPQGLRRWGIRAIVGESFSEIFFGNALALGVPCVSVDPEAADWLIAHVQQNPSAVVRVDVGALTVTCGDRVFPARLPRPAQEALLSGAWDATGLLLDGEEETRAVADRLPYVSGF